MRNITNIELEKEFGVNRFTLGRWSKAGSARLPVYLALKEVIEKREMLAYALSEIRKTNQAEQETEA